MRLSRRAMPGLVIELGRRRVRALGAEATRSGVWIRQVLDEPIPEPLAAASEEEFAAWLARVLDEAGLPRGRTLLALGRDSVVAKRLVLPGATAAELPEMVRLAMLRELPPDVGEAIVDFLPAAVGAPRLGADPPAERPRQSAGRADGEERSVIAFAAPAAPLAAVRARLAAAGRPVAMASLRLLGTVALIEALPPQRRGSRGTVVVDVTADGVELVVLVDGRIDFSRGAELRPAGEGPERLVEVALPEIRRSWLSYRLGHGAEEVDAAVLVAERGVADALRGALGEAIGLPVETVLDHPVLREDLPARAARPLAGLLLRGGTPMLDFLSPRRSPDLAARRRQWSLAAAGLLLLSGFAGWTVGAAQAARVADRRAELAEKARGAVPEGWRLRRDEDKLRHLEQWTKPAQDWIDDLVYVQALLPAPGEVVLDSVAATRTAGAVRWDAKRGYSSGAEVRIVLEGEAKTRATADGLREKLIADQRFRVTTSGSDARGGNRLPYPFGYLLNALRSDPPLPESGAGNGARAAAAIGPAEGAPARPAAPEPPDAGADEEPGDDDGVAAEQAEPMPEPEAEP